MVSFFYAGEYIFYAKYIFITRFMVYSYNIRSSKKFILSK